MLSLPLLLCLAVASARFLQRPMTGSSDERWFSQRVDHFNAFKAARFQQRYFLNEEFFQAGAKVALIEIGGEGEIRSAPGGTKANPDMLGRIAAQYGARIYHLEHRFYGKSHPFPLTNDTYDTSSEHLALLTSRQAIGDLVEFIAAMDRDNCPPGLNQVPGRPCLRWVVVGGSYPGALAGWISEHHPSLFAAGLASSGVVNAEFENPDFDTHTLAVAGAPCGQALLEASRGLVARIAAGDKALLARLGVPEGADLGDVYYYLADASLMCFQYGHSAECCDARLVPAWEQHASVEDALVDYLVSASSFSTYDSTPMKNATVKRDSAFRQWWAQTCLEMAYFQPMPDINALRSPAITTEWHLEMCSKLFGWDLGDPTIRTNEYYGGEDTRAPDCFYSNFYQDIWHLCSKTSEGRDDKGNIGYIRCKDCGHCADLHADKDTDPRELTALRARIEAFVRGRVDAQLARAK